MSKKHLLPGLALSALFAGAPAQAYDLSITSDTLQTLDGFGTSVTWSGGEIMRLPAAERERVLRMFFTDEGAGISIIRMRLVAKTDDDFAYQAQVAQWAKAQGVSRFYATVWNVPGTFLDANQKLLPARFDDFAGFIADFIRDMGTEGIPIGWIGVQNEPDNGPKLAASWTVDYNKYTVHYYRSKAELRDFSVALKRVLAARGMGTVKLLGPECMGWQGTRELTQAQFETAEGKDALDVIGTHVYWGAERDADMNPVRVEMAALAKAQGKRLWQTEYSRFDCLPGCTEACQQQHVAQDPARLQTDATFNIQDGLEMAEYLYRDLSLANANAWLYWWTHNPNKGCGGNGATGMHNSFNGMAVIKADNTFFFPKRFHVLSHYMRFLRPGHVRLRATTDGEAAIHPMAFRDSSGNKVTVVVYNRGTAAAPVTVTLPGFPALTSVKPWITSESAEANVQAGSAATFTASAGHAFQLPARSIMTLVFEKPGSTAIRRARPEAPALLFRKGEKGETRTLHGRRVKETPKPK